MMIIIIMGQMSTIVIMAGTMMASSSSRVHPLHPEVLLMELEEEII